MILAAGLTPAWQRTLVFDSFRPGQVNRARESRECASGKVLNVALALRHLGAETRSLSVCGGATGTALREDLGALGVPARWIDSAAPTRTCTTLLSNGTMTELVENAGAVEPRELQAFVDAFAEEARRAKVIVLTGSLPSGTPASIYRTLLENASAPVVLDARGPELLETLSLKPLVVKPNRTELSVTLGRDLSDDRALLDAMAEINARGAGWVVVTDGAGPVRVFGDGAAHAFRPPAVKTLNPIGCGDCLAAGLALTIARGGTVLEGVRAGMAAAADNVARLLPARLDPERVASLTGAVEVIDSA